MSLNSQIMNLSPTSRYISTIKKKKTETELCHESFELRQ